MHVFISYAHHDVELAEAVAIRLRHEGHSVFFDRANIPSGDTFDRTIRKAIKDSDFMLFLASPESLSDGAYALTELDLFKTMYPSSANRVLTVRLRGIANDSIPVYLRSVSVADIDGDLAAGITAKALDCLQRLSSFRRKRTSLATLLTVAVMIVLLLAFGIWRVVFPPQPEPGIELSLHTVRVMPDGELRAANEQIGKNQFPGTELAADSANWILTKFTQRFPQLEADAITMSPEDLEANADAVVMRWIYQGGRKFLLVDALDDVNEVHHFVAYPFHSAALVTYASGDFDSSSFVLTRIPSCPIVVQTEDANLFSSIETELASLGFRVLPSAKLTELKGVVAGLGGFEDEQQKFNQIETAYVYLIINARRINQYFPPDE